MLRRHCSGGLRGRLFPFLHPCSLLEALYQILPFARRLQCALGQVQRSRVVQLERNPPLGHPLPKVRRPHPRLDRTQHPLEGATRFLPFSQLRLLYKICNRLLRAQVGNPLCTQRLTLCLCPQNRIRHRPFRRSQGARRVLVPTLHLPNELLGECRLANMRDQLITRMGGLVE